MTRSLRIAIVDDHPLILEGMRQIFVKAGHDVVEATSDVEELLSRLKDLQLNALTLDIGMPGRNGIEVGRQIHATFPQIAIIMVTQQTDKAYLRAALQAGALGFVSKQSAGRELVAALEAASRGRVFISPHLIGVSEDPRAAVKILLGNKPDVLTTRQQAVLQHIAEGKAMKEIAAAMNISIKTVEFHKKSLSEVLGISTTAELTKYAIAHGHAFLAN